MIATQMQPDQQFRLFWFNGTTEVVQGPTIGEAVSRMGYGQGAMRALDFFSKGDELNYTWDSDINNWVPNNRIN